MAKKYVMALIEDGNVEDAVEMLLANEQNLESEDSTFFPSLNTEQRRFVLREAMNILHGAMTKNMASSSLPSTSFDQNQINERAQTAFRLMKATVESQKTLAQKYKESSRTLKHLETPEGKTNLADNFFRDENVSQEAKNYFVKVLLDELRTLHSSYEQQYKDQIRSNIDKARQADSK